MRLLCVLSLLTATLGTTIARKLPDVGYERFASGFSSPIALLSYGSGEQAFLVVDQIGVISFLGSEGGEASGTFLDLRDKMVELKPKFDERGALGLALHPDFKNNQKCYVYYSVPLRKDGKAGYDHTARLSEFKVKTDGKADLTSERVLLEVDQPQFNHDGGYLVFGPDGYLYMGLGDGGAANDRGKGHEPEGNGQSLKRLLGKILRIDVNSGDPYGIPKDNPLVGKPGRDEIYAWGIRNPWGMTLDKGDLIVADVGQNRFEEINIIVKGGNYGWPRYEGYAPFNADSPGEVVVAKKSSAPEGFVAPVLVYPHNESYGKAAGYGISVTGGHVYRGKTLPDLDGVYLFADWVFSWASAKMGLYAGVRDEKGEWTMQIVPGAKAPDEKQRMITGFGQDAEGEVYVLTNAGRGPAGKSGEVWKIVPAK